PHGLLGRVGRGRDVVRGEDREARDLGDALLGLGFAAETAAEQDPAHPSGGASQGATGLEGILGRQDVALTPAELAAADDLDARIAGKPALRALDALEPVL